MANTSRTSQSTARNQSTNRESRPQENGGNRNAQQDVQRRSSSAQSDAQRGSASETPRQPSAEREREMQIGREGQPQQQRGVIREGQAGSAANTTNNPFTFMRRFAEEMDRLFDDFGYASVVMEPYGAGRSRIGGSGANASLGSGGSRQRGLSSGAGVATRTPGSLFDVRSDWMPQVEVLQRGENLVVRADLPGMKREDVAVEIDDGVLTLSGQRNYESSGEDGGIYHSERSYGSFSRSIPLPPGVSAEACQARFADGVLEITLPIPKEQSRSRKIQIG